MPTPIVTITPTVTGTGTTLAAYYRRLADELGFRQLTATSQLATGPDAARYVIADELGDDEAGYVPMGQPWLYAASGVQAQTQRRLLDPSQRDGGVGYQGTTSAAIVSRKFDAALANNTTIELTGPLPIRDHLGVRGIATLVNEALARLWVEARILITGNGTYEYDFAGYPYLRRATQLQGLYDTVWSSSTYPAELSPWTYRWVVSGADRSLITDMAYTTADTFQVAAMVRADALVYDGATWAYTATPGLQDDDWQAAADIEHVVAYGMVKALQYCAKVASSPFSPPQLRESCKAALADPTTGKPRMAIWGPVAAEIKRKEQPQPLPARAPSMVYGGHEQRWS